MQTSISQNLRELDAAECARVEGGNPVLLAEAAAVAVVGGVTVAGAFIAAFAAGWAIGKEIAGSPQSQPSEDGDTSDKNTRK